MLKEIKSGNIKQTVRRLKGTLPLTKILSMQPDLREYLLYCCIHAHAAAGATLYLPEFLKRKDVTNADYEEHGAKVGTAKPQQQYGHRM